jgi:hypothetical protein
MDAQTFDSWIKTLAHRPTRRVALQLLAGGLLGGVWLKPGTVFAQLDDGQEVADPYITPVPPGGYGPPGGCAGPIESCDTLPCCVGECGGQDANICICAADGEECVGIEADQPCCSGALCNENGFCGNTCRTFGTPCDTDEQCCSGGQYGMGLCCFSGVTLSTICTDVTNSGFVCP